MLFFYSCCFCLIKDMGSTDKHTGDCIAVIFPTTELLEVTKDDAGICKKDLTSSATSASTIATQYVKQSELKLTNGDLSNSQSLCCQLLHKYDDHIRYDTSLGQIIINLFKGSLSSFGYFSALFSSGMIEAQQSKIEMKTISLIEFIHAYEHSTGGRSIESCDLCRLSYPTLLFQMLDTAVYLQHNGLFADIVEYLIVNMTKRTCVRVLIAAETYSHAELLSTAMKFCLYYADHVIKHSMDEFMGNISKKTLDAFVNHPQLMLKNEETVEKLKAFKLSPPNDACKVSK